MQGRPVYKPDTYQEHIRTPLPMNYPNPYQMGNPLPYGYPAFPYQAPYYPLQQQPINILNNNNNSSSPASNNNNNNIVVNVTSPVEKKS